MYTRVRHIILICVAFLASASAWADEQFVASTFSKAALYIYSPDFIYEPVTEWFSEKELSILEQNSSELNSMVQDALNFGQSVGGAALTAHFKLKENIPLLRWHLFQPGTPYGWEGPDYSDEEAYLADNQFVYHSVYLDAIEVVSAQPIHKAIQPTDREIRELSQLLEDQSNEQYYWAKWLARKLLLIPPTG